MPLPSRLSAAPPTAAPLVAAPLSAALCDLTRRHPRMMLAFRLLMADLALPHDLASGIF